MKANTSSEITRLESAYIRVADIRDKYNRLHKEDGARLENARGVCQRDRIKWRMEHTASLADKATTALTAIRDLMISGQIDL